jgi:hypothetical protein
VFNAISKSAKSTKDRRNGEASQYGSEKRIASLLWADQISGTHLQVDDWGDTAAG